MGLYQKHRPSSFDDVVGNESTVASLKGLLAKGAKTAPSCFLFHGPAGCGKTTLGRIVAKELGCADSDFTEMDTADFRGIDSMREIRRNVHFRPMSGPVRVWLLDECHQITNDGQDALLKALEDAPAHAFFILCTTDPQKLKKTVRSRCSEYAVSSLSPSDILKILKKVCISERIKIPGSVAKLISQESMGSPRTALVTLEQVAGLKEEQMEQVALAKIQEEEETNKLCQVLLKGGPWKQVAKELAGIKGSEESVRRGVLGYMSTVLLRSGNPTAYHIMDCFAANYYDTGKAGLIMSCWEAVSDDGGGEEPPF